MFTHYNPRDFWEFANQLIADHQYDAKTRHRTVVGRAYYAAFLLVKRRLEELGYSFQRTERMHQDVIETVLAQSSTFGNKLETIRSYRVDSDYRMEMEVNENMARRCLLISKEIIQSIGELRP